MQISLRRVHPKISEKEDPLSTLSSSADFSQNQQLVELLLQCHELQLEKQSNNINALCVLFRRQFGRWKEFALTEVVHNETSPAVSHAKKADQIWEAEHCYFEK